MTPSMLHLLKCSTYAAWSSNLIGGPEVAHWRFQWFKNFAPGHLVMETSTVWYDSRDNERFGYLIAVERDNWHTDEEWETIKGDYGEDQPRPQDTFWRLRLLSDNSEYRWRNGAFIRVPLTLREFADISDKHIIGGCAECAPQSNPGAES